MDTRTGEVISIKEMEKRINAGDDRIFYKEIPYRRSQPKTGRNALCPCGSGKKFKKCCLYK